MNAAANPMRTHGFEFVEYAAPGEGNFQALFESIEMDQKRRGVI